MGASDAPGAARGLRWNDPALGIKWPATPVAMSPNDAAYDDIDLDSFSLGGVG
jgi:dTDP-4-dehydrorhamnose 3,5-epimerase